MCLNVDDAKATGTLTVARVAHEEIVELACTIIAVPLCVVDSMAAETKASEGLAGAEKQKRFEVKKWNAVCLWAWGEAHDGSMRATGSACGPYVADMPALNSR